jgi:hypothetical protein
LIVRQSIYHSQVPSYRACRVESTCELLTHVLLSHDVAYVGPRLLYVPYLFGKERVSSAER